jgi:hypothetical protein
MPVHWQLVVDAGDPHGQARFWAAALGYLVEDNSALIVRLRGAGAIGPGDVQEFDGRPAWRDLIAVRHPEDPVNPATGSGLGRRILFQRVPEGKVVKNRVHLDVRVGTGLVGEERLAALEAECERLLPLGAERVRLLYDGTDSCIVMQDLEGNEFCLD